MNVRIYNKQSKRFIKAEEEVHHIGLFRSLIDGSIVNAEGVKQDHLIDVSQNPSCYGEMNWILKYEPDKVPRDSICQCGCSKSCQTITREIEKAIIDSHYEALEKLTQGALYEFVREQGPVKVMDMQRRFRTGYHHTYDLACQLMNQDMIKSNNEGWIVVKSC